MTGKLARWRRGEPIAASKLNQTVAAVDMLATQASDDRRRTRGIDTRPVRFQVVEVFGDYVTARRAGMVANDSGAIVPGFATAETKIAKPPLLRNSTTSRGSATYSYTGIDERTATVGGDTEDQVVVPSYLAGDTIFAEQVEGGTGVTVEETFPDGARTIGVRWQDANIDARAWAKAAT